MEKGLPKYENPPKPPSRVPDPAFEQYLKALKDDSAVASIARALENGGIFDKEDFYTTEHPNAGADYFQPKLEFIRLPKTETIFAEDIHARTMRAQDKAIAEHKDRIIRKKAGAIDFEDLVRVVVETDNGLEERVICKATETVIVTFLPPEIVQTFSEDGYKMEYKQKHI